MRVLEAGSRGPRLRSLSGGTRQADLCLGQQGSLGGLDEASDDAGEREPPESRRPACAPVSRPANGGLLLRCWRRTARGVCSADRLIALYNSRRRHFDRYRGKGFDVATLQELMAQKEAIERQIEQTKTHERGAAIEKVRTLMAEYGLSMADLGGRTS